MKPSFDPSELRQAPLRQYVLRFVFGGLISVATGVIAKLWGPSIGGLFLAFPAVLPASLAFVRDEDGRASAVEDARGSRIGAVALLGFALFVAHTAGAWAPAAVLAGATMIWTAISWIGWTVCFGRSRREP
jgi:hypothetical protein